jgi:dUTP pyrophosphatase
MSNTTTTESSSSLSASIDEFNKATTLKFVKVHENAKLPQKNHDNDTGYDVFCVEDKVIAARGSAVVDVGLKFANIPIGTWIKVEGRSGLGFKHGIVPHPGIIDNGYRGDAGIKLYNMTDVDYQVKAGDRIAQFVLYPLISLHSPVAFAEEALDSARGEKGFGSSGQ